MTSLTDRSASAPFDNLNQRELLSSPTPVQTKAEPFISSPHDDCDECGRGRAQRAQSLIANQMMGVPVIRRPAVVRQRLPLVHSAVPLPQVGVSQRPLYSPAQFRFPDIMDNRNHRNIWDNDPFSRKRKSGRRR